MCSKEFGLCVQNSSTILDVVVNVIGWGEGERAICSYNNFENLHFDNEYDIHRSYEDYEKNGYKNELDLLIISH